MSTLIAQAVREAGENDEILDIRSVSGGEINEAFKVSTKGSHHYFVKLNKQMQGDFFESEKEGLELLRSSQTIAIPKVYFCGEVDGTACLVLEWIEGSQTGETVGELGQQTALMHQNHGEAYGLEEDNYLGTFEQPNGWHDDWVAFYRDKRLSIQVELAEKKGRLNLKRRKGLEQILSRLGKWIPSDVAPSLLHGDLWGGNWLAGTNGKPYLIDPAVYYGHHEVELAFTELFGGFPQRFYDTYREVHPISREYEDRRELYQLYYLLVHLNAFGESYGGSVDRVIKKYV